MFTTALPTLLLSLLLASPAGLGGLASVEANDAGDGGARVVFLGEDDVELDGDGPLVVRVGSRNFIGLTLQDIGPSLRAHFGAPREHGVLVEDVVSDSPAAKAGVQVGDVIVSVDGDPVRWSGDLSREIRGKKAGDAVELEIVRNGAARKLSVTVEERKSKDRLIDLDLGDLPDHIRRHSWKDGDKVRPFVMRNWQDLPDLRDRLEELEKRVKELEKKLAR